MNWDSKYTKDRKTDTCTTKRRPVKSAIPVDCNQFIYFDNQAVAFSDGMSTCRCGMYTSLIINSMAL